MSETIKVLSPAIKNRVEGEIRTGKRWMLIAWVGFIGLGLGWEIVEVIVGDEAIRWWWRVLSTAPIFVALIIGLRMILVKFGCPYCGGNVFPTVTWSCGFCDNRNYKTFDEITRVMLPWRKHPPMWAGCHYVGCQKEPVAYRCQDCEQDIVFDPDRYEAGGEGIAWTHKLAPKPDPEDKNVEFLFDPLEKDLD